MRVRVGWPGNWRSGKPENPATANRVRAGPWADERPRARQRREWVEEQRHSDPLANPVGHRRLAGSWNDNRDRSGIFESVALDSRREPHVGSVRHALCISAHRERDLVRLAQYCRCLPRTRLLIDSGRLRTVLSLPIATDATARCVPWKSVAGRGGGSKHHAMPATRASPFKER